MFQSIDAAVYHPLKQIIYFFSGSKFIKYKVNVGIEPISPGQDIGAIGIDGWSGITDDFKNGIDAAYTSSNGHIYMFKGSKYIKWGLVSDTQVAGYPLGIAAYWNINAPTGVTEDNLDAVMYDRSKKVVSFFKDGAVMGQNQVQSNIDLTLLPTDFQMKTDAVLYWSPRQVLFFSGSQYLIMDPEGGVIPGYPKTLDLDALDLTKPVVPTPVAGPMCGAVTGSTADIWIWSAETMAGQGYRVQLNGVEHPFTLHDPAFNTDTVSVDSVKNAIAGIAPGSEIQTLRLSNLASATRYNFDLYKGDEWVSAIKFKTAPAATGNITIKVLLGSCSDTTEHDDAPIYHQMVTEGADLMVMAGDNCYYYDSLGYTTSPDTVENIENKYPTTMEHEWHSATSMLKRQLAARTQADFKALLRNTAFISTWDDHDFGYNNAQGSHDANGHNWAGREVAANVYRAMWNHGYDTSSTHPTNGIFYQRQYGPVHIFMTDGRFNKDVDEDKSTDILLGAVQEAWLKDRLENSSSPLKVIVFGGRVLRPSANSTGHRGGEGLVTEGDSEYTKLTDVLKGSTVSGKILLLSGDIHYSDCFTLEELGDASNPVDHKVVEVTSSPLRVNPKHNQGASTNLTGQRLYSGNGESYTALNITLNLAADGTTLLAGSQITMDAKDTQGVSLVSALDSNEQCSATWNLESGVISLN